MTRIIRIAIQGSLLLIFAWGSAWGCSQKGVTNGDQPDIQAPKTDTNVQADTNKTEDTSDPQDTAQSQDTGGPQDTAEPEDTAPDPNCDDTIKPAGCSCQDNDACASGYCYPTNQGKECAQLCESDCPEGYVCSPIAGTGGDPVYLCIQRTINLCKPCNENADCVVPGFEGKDTCVPYGDSGSFCGLACSENSPCPGGYGCSDGQCVKDDKTCACEPLFIELEASTACDNTNDYGTCSGTRTCTEEGLSECSGQVPAKDGCDTLDNDCDGAIDEDCVLQLRGKLMGDGFNPGATGDKFKMRGSAGTPRFVGTSSDNAFKLKAGLPPKAKKP